MTLLARSRLAWLMWSVVALASLLLPLLVLWPGAAVPPRGFNQDFAIALGYAATLMFMLQFVLTARFRRATAPFGIDLVYYFHRYFAICALLIVVAHCALLLVQQGRMLGVAGLLIPGPQLLAGMLSMLLLLLLAVSSLARRRWRFEYERWRRIHAALAVLAVALALWHLFGSARYLDHDWKRRLWFAVAAVWLLLVLYVRAWRPWRVSRSPWRVTALRNECGSIWTLTLQPTQGGVPRFLPGQFAWLSLRASPFAMREHPFSIASSACNSQRIELSIKELGDFTATIKDTAVGETAWVDAPYGAFSIDGLPGADGFVFIAGGIGIAPMMSMLRSMADRGDARPVLLLYGNRVWERVAFRDELESLRQRMTLDVVHCLLEPPAVWNAERGMVTDEVLGRHLPVPRPGLHCFVCGPAAMTRAIERGLARLRFRPSRVHSELFDWV